jgi:intracellular septation protein A
MKPFLKTLQLLISDLAASLLFLVLFSATHNALLAAGLGILLGMVQVAWNLIRKKPVDAMQWLSLFLVIASGAATVLTDDPRFVLFKPSVIYLIVALAMLKRGWLNRYLPPIAQAVASDAGVALGYTWAALMAISAILNAYLAINAGMETWAMAMGIFAVASKLALFIGGFVAIRLVTRARIAAMPADKREALLVTTGWTAGSTSPATAL